jgi:hypothetical protein
MITQACFYCGATDEGGEPLVSVQTLALKGQRPLAWCRCENCGARGPEADTPEEAEAAWNGPPKIG